MLMDGSQYFTTGTCQYQDDLAGQEASTSKLYIEVKVGDFPVFAMVDTGAPYCVFEPELLAELGYTFDRGNVVELSTRIGRKLGTIHRIPVTILANEGSSLYIDSTFFVPESWSGNFLGFMGCLQRFRFAIDPGNNIFHFGKYPA